MTRAKMPHVTEADFVEVGRQLNALREKYLQERLELVKTLLNVQDIINCNKCTRPMIPRSVWTRLSEEVRELIHKDIMRAGTRTQCATCRVYVRRVPLSAEKLADLRAKVGYA